MKENQWIDFPKKGKKPRRIGYLKMKVIDDLKKETVNKVVQDSLSSKSELIIDDSTSFVNLKSYEKSHYSEVIPKG